MNTMEYEIYRKADEMYRQGPDWVTFFRQILGVNGVVRSAYSDPALLAASFRAVVVGLEMEQRVEPVLDVDTATAALASVVGIRYPQPATAGLT